MKRFTNRQIAYAMLLANSIIWGVSPGIIKIGLEKIHPFQFLYYRHIICVLFVIIYLIIAKRVMQAIKAFRSPLNLLVMFLLTPGILIIQFYGIKLTSSTEASIAIATAPLFASLLGAKYLKEKISKSELLGTIIAFVGIIMISLLGAGSNNISLEQNLLGIFLILISAIVWAGGNILYKKIPEKDRFMVSIDSFFLSVLTFIVIFLFWNPSFIIPVKLDSPTLWSILYMAIPGSLIAFTFVQKGISLIEVSEATMFTYLQPVWGVPFAVFFLKEPFDLIMLLPLVIILFGLYINIKDKLKNVKNISRTV